MIAAILRGDTEQYHELIRPYERGVYTMALALLRNEGDAEEVAQETFLKAFRALGEFRGEAKFSTWLISIAVNEARGRLRRRVLAPMVSLDEEAEDGGLVVPPALLRDWREVPLEALERKEVRAMLEEAMAGLRPIYREVLVMRDVEEFSIAETAQTLGISAGSVKVRLHRARMMMQKELAPKLKSTMPRRRWLPWF